MAYSKKTWKARQGLGLNKFSIDGATPVPVINQPDSVTQQGDALSAGNINDLENRIANAFDDVENEKADKTETDDLQSQIINLNTDVATLDAIVGGEAEVENTDPSEGQSILASSRLIHHVNLLPSGEFGLVGARDVKWNQLIVKGNFPSDTTTEWLTSSATKSISNNVCTVTPSGSNAQLWQNFTYMKGHVYLAVGEVKLSSAVSSVRMIVNGTNVVSTYASSNTSWQTLTAIMTESTGVTGSLIFRDNNGSTAFDVRNVNTFDLTDMDMASLTASQFRALFPASFYPHDAGSIVNLNPTGFSIRGIQLWDEEVESGTINSTTGQNEANASLLRSKNYIPVTSGKEYFILNRSVVVFAYDINKNFLGYASMTDDPVGYIASTTGVAYLRFRTVASYGTTYNHDIQIADNSLPSSVKTVYHPFSGQTVPVSISGHYVNESVYDYVTNKTVDGVLRGEVHTRGGVYTFTGNETWTGWSSSSSFCNNLQTLIKPATSNSVAYANMITDSSMSIVPANQVDNGNGIGVTTGGAFICKNTDRSNLTGKTIYFEANAETVTYTEPLRSFSLTDYATIEPITPQTLPNRVDVPFSILSKSNNGLIEQIRTNTADIADNKQILSQHEARIANLEQVSGEYVQTDLQDYSSVPTGKASFALVETLKGVSRVENQLMPIVSSFSRSSSGVTYVSDGNGKYSISGLSSGISETRVTDVLVFPKGHRFLIATTKPMSYGTARIIIWVNDSQFAGVYYGGQSDSASDTAKLFTIDDSWFNETIWFNVQNGKNPSISDLQIIIHDLTQYFSSDPSVDVSTLTISDIQSKYPELLIPSDYTAGEIKNSTYTKVESRGVNLWDEETELGALNGQTGGNYPATDSLRSVNYIPVTPSTVYYGKIPVAYMNIYYYRQDKSFIGTTGRVSNSTFTTPSDAYFIRLEFNSGYGTTYNHDIQICLNSYTDKTTYHPHMTDQLAIPSVTLKGAGSVSEVYDLETGEVTHPLYVVDMGDLSASSYDNSNAPLCSTTALMSIVKKVDNANVANILVTGYVARSRTDVTNNPMTISVNSGGVIVFNDPNTSSSWTKEQLRTYMEGKILIVELDTPNPSTFVTPVLNNTLRTEGGGSVFTDADVDGRFTLGFLNL